MGEGNHVAHRQGSQVSGTGFTPLEALASWVLLREHLSVFAFTASLKQPVPPCICCSAGHHTLLQAQAAFFG